MSERSVSKSRRLLGKAVKVAIAVIGTIVALLAVAIILGPYLIPTSAVERAVSNKTKEDLGRPATLGDFSLSLVTGVKLTLTDLVIQEKEGYGARPFLKVDKVTLDADIWPMLGRKFVVNKLTIEQPELSVVKNREGQYNILDFPEKPEEEPFRFKDLPKFRISKSSLSNGTIHFTDLSRNESSKLQNINGEIIAAADPPRETAELTKAVLTFDGFSASARGAMAPANGKTTVNDFVADAAIDFDKLGEVLAAILPVKLAGTSTYHASIDGPLTALKTQSEFVLLNFEITGEQLREPARIQKLTSRQSSVIDAENLSAKSIISEVQSDSLGISGKLTGHVANLREASGIDLQTESRIDLDKLSAFANAFAPRAVKAAGKLTTKGTMTGDFDKDFAARGLAQIDSFRLESPAMPEPYTEERMSFVYDLLLQEKKKVTVNDFKFDSALLSAQASGSAAPDAANLNGTAHANLANISALLAGLGLLPPQTSFEGELDGKLAAKTAEKGINCSFDAKIKNFILSSPYLDQPYREDQMTMAGSLMAVFQDAQIDSIRDGRLKMTSKLAAADATFAASQLSGQPRVNMVADVLADLAPIADLLIAMGSLEKDSKASGKLEATITVRTEEQAADGRQQQPARHHAAAESPGVQLAFAGNDPAVLAMLAQAAAAQSPNGPMLPESMDRFIVTTDVKSTGKIIYNQIEVDKLTAKVNLAKRVLAVDATADLYEGKFDMTSESALGADPPTHKFTCKARGITLREELGRLFGRFVPLLALPLGQIEGRLDGEGQFTAEGADSEKMLRSLNGIGEAAMPEDVRVRLPVLGEIAGLQQFANIRFGRMGSAVRVRNGIAANETVFTAPDLTLRLAGTTQLYEPRKIEYRLTMAGDRVAKTLGFLLKDKKELPIGLSGTLDEPKAKLLVSNLLIPLLDRLKLP